ncbi:MAG: LPS export ABC transporter permease LptG [Candidatus Manganitrophaceae bacterium]|nr:MAG: LPS export ABC transporter permease LptG [Candidatus Manganitrophaceae bacterium]
MSIISRYILKEYLKFFSVVLSILSLVYLTIEFLEKIRKFSERDAEILFVVQYFLFKIPKIIFDVAPLAVLIATFLTLGMFSRNNEIIAFKSSGVSLLKLTAPLLLFGIFLSSALFFLNGTLVPSTYKKAKMIQEIKIEKKNDDGRLVQNKMWLRLDSRTLFNIELVEPNRQKMFGVNIYYLGSDFSLPESIEAEGLTYKDGSWILSKGVHRTFQPDGTVQIKRFDEERIGINKKPDDFKQAVAEPEEMTYRRLRAYIDRLSGDGFDATRYRVDLLAKQAFPFVNFMMVLVGIPFALQDRRSAKVARGAALSLGLALCYWLVFSVTLTLGRINVLPPWIAAWGANLLFLGIGSYLFLNIRH